jgi:aspartate-semialdehyde dehydrogenase
LSERRFPVAAVRALASERSAGQQVSYDGTTLGVEPVGENSFEGTDLALFAAGAELSQALAPFAVEAGAVVVDNSSAWRMKENVPLVVPEVNAADIGNGEGIIANPNCCAIPLAMVLQPLRQIAGIQRVIVATYQSASGAGKKLVDELARQTRAIAAGQEPEHSVYPHQLAYNVVPGGWKVFPEAFNEEEWKLVQETRKILHEPDLPIVATCVRVPVPVGHAEAVFVETSNAISPQECRELLAAAPGVVVQDDPERELYPTPAEVAGTDEVYVGRIRRDLSTRHGLALWIVSDNLRKGAALNAVQIAEFANQMGVI